MLMRFGEKITQEVAKVEKEEVALDITEWYDHMCEKRKFEEEVHLMANLQHKWVDVFKLFFYYHSIQSICEVFSFHFMLFIQI